MSSMRQLGSGLLYALVSVVLVVGGLSLALAEGGINAPPTGLPSSTSPVPSAGSTAAPGPTPIPSVAPSATVQVVIPTATGVVIVPSATAIVIVPSATGYVQPAPSLRPVASSTRPVYATAISCGPYYGWIRNYTVQPGDTLFHIATLYRTTVSALQVANCKSTAIIFPGEHLWVPNVPTITPGVTLIPTFATSTPVPTEPLTLTPVPSYFTETAIPTETSNASP